MIGSVWPGLGFEQAERRIQAPAVLVHRADGDTEVLLDVYALNGVRLRTIVSGWLPEGDYMADWDTGSTAPGIYLVRLRAGDNIIVRKVIINR